MTTTEPTAPGVVMREPGTGRPVWAMNSLFEHLLDAGEGAEFGAALVTQPPGTATPLHRHTREAESFFVLDGRLDYRAGEEMFELYEGCFIYLPRALPHAFRVRGDRPCRILAIVAPPGLLGLYDEVGVPAPEHRLPDGDGRPLEEEIARWNETGPRYGLEVVGPPIPE